MFYKYVIFICLTYVLIYYNTIQSIHVLIHYNHTSRKKIFFFQIGVSTPVFWPV